jgi:hypothetical protein
LVAAGAALIVENGALRKTSKDTNALDLSVEDQAKFAQSVCILRTLNA